MAGILNALPYQHHVYRGYSRETGIVRFIRGQDPIFAAYRYLARAPGVAAVWQTDRAYFNLPGYYYLHRAIPLYAGDTAPLIFAGPEASESEAIARGQPRGVLGPGSCHSRLRGGAGVGYGFCAGRRSSRRFAASRITRRRSPGSSGS